MLLQNHNSIDISFFSYSVIRVIKLNIWLIRDYWCLRFMRVICDSCTIHVWFMCKSCAMHIISVWFTSGFTSQFNSQFTLRFALQYDSWFTLWFTSWLTSWFILIHIKSPNVWTNFGFLQNWPLDHIDVLQIPITRYLVYVMYVM